MKLTNEQKDELLRRMPLLPTPRVRDGNCGDSIKGILHNAQRRYLDGTIAMLLMPLAGNPGGDTNQKGGN